jgi:hypothetical protein
MFGNWLNGIDTDTKSRICMGVSAIFWAIWNCQKNIIFNKQIGFIFYRLFGWLHIGSIYGSISSRWISGNLWLLAATGYRWLLGTSISRLLDDDILLESQMDRFLMFFILDG